MIPDGEYECVQCRDIPISTILEETTNKLKDTDEQLCEQESQKTRIELKRMELEEEYDKQIGPREKRLKDVMGALNIVPCAYHGNIFTGIFTNMFYK